MRRPVFPGILLLLLLYCVVFVVLVTVQFTKRGGFTQKVGDFVVTGHYRLPEENEPALGTDEYLLDGNVHVFFGGIDFGLVVDEKDRSLLVGRGDGAEPVQEAMLPERMAVSPESVVFTFPGGTELEFASQYAGGARELRISGNFPEGVSGLELPFKPLKRTETVNSGEGQLVFRADGMNYSFGRFLPDTAGGTLRVNAGAASLSYRAIPEKRKLSLEDFILPGAAGAEVYNEALNHWRDLNFSLWSRVIAERLDEDTVVAFGGEALVRGTYKAAVAAVPQAFLRSANRSHESAVYLGGLAQAYRLFTVREREKLTRLSRQLNDNSLEFLLEPRVFEYFAVRGHRNFIDAGAELVKTIDPATLALDIVPGILEGFTDWKTLRPGVENPFERLVDQACFVVFDALERSPGAAGDRVFAFHDNRGDAEFNTRLGKALIAYAESVTAEVTDTEPRNSAWAGIGRSLVLSALFMEDAAGEVPAALIRSENGLISESVEKIAASKLYRILDPLNDSPGAVPIGAIDGVWAWTAARNISASQRNDILDINVSFPAGETHYMLIRGIRPFSRVRLYNMDFRSDPQFERYDSSGWVYYPQDQILVLKMKHRSREELIRIIFREETPPAPAVSPVSPREPVSGTEPAAAPPPAGVPVTPVPPPAGDAAPREGTP